MKGNAQRGFTIIEMLIVLAIAGLILSLILIVIPVLQRDGRNNQRKQDVEAILGGVSNYGLNNSGNLPPNSSFTSKLKLTYYDAPEAITVEPRAPRQAVSGTPTLDTVIIANYQKCDSDNPGAPTQFAAGYSDIVALYRAETGGGNTAQRCQEL